MSNKEETVRVCVRCRPLNSKERQNGNQKVVEMDTTRGTVVLQPANSQPSEVPKTFTFDQVYDDTTKQENLYAQTASRIVDSVLEGFNGTIFAYGQTGTGKTFTMEGVNEPPELRGIIPRAFHQIFDAIATRGGSDTLATAPSITSSRFVREPTTASIAGAIASSVRDTSGAIAVDGAYDGGAMAVSSRRCAAVSGSPNNFCNAMDEGSLLPTTDVCACVCECACVHACACVCVCCIC